MCGLSLQKDSEGFAIMKQIIRRFNSDYLVRRSQRRTSADTWRIDIAARSDPLMGLAALLDTRKHASRTADHQRGATLCFPSADPMFHFQGNLRPRIILCCTSNHYILLETTWEKDIAEPTRAPAEGVSENASLPLQLVLVGIKILQPNRLPKHCLRLSAPNGC